MRVEKQSTVWQPNSNGSFDALKLKINNFVIDQTINYLGTNFNKQKLVNLAKVFEKIAGSKGYFNQNIHICFGGNES